MPAGKDGVTQDSYITVTDEKGLTSQLFRTREGDYELLMHLSQPLTSTEDAKAFLKTIVAELIDLSQSKAPGKRLPFILI